MDNKYINYIKSEKWAKKKQELFQEKGKKCELCGSTKHIHVHHLTYERLYNELIIDLQPLCRSCHEKEHGRKFTFGAKSKQERNKNRRKKRAIDKKKTLSEAQRIKNDLKKVGHNMPDKKQRKLIACDGQIINARPVDGQVVMDVQIVARQRDRLRRGKGPRHVKVDRDRPA